MTSPARFDLAALLAAVETTTDGGGRVELRFSYPSSQTGEPILRRVRRPVLLHTSRDGWVLRGRDAARGGQLRAFTVARIAASPAPRALPRGTP